VMMDFLKSHEASTPEDIELDFSLKTVGEWRNCLEKTNRPTWNQTFQYASATAKTAHQSTRFATIVKSDVIIGLVSIQELKLGPIHHVNIYRGPLWFDGQNTEVNFKAFAKALKSTFPQRPLRKIRWLPEWPDGYQSDNKFLADLGYKKKTTNF